MTSLNQYRIGIIGLGQMGGSIAAALKRSGHERPLTACDSNSALIAEGLTNKIIDDGADEPAALIKESDIVILALPVAQIVEIIGKFADVLSTRVLVTDTGSLKTQIMEEARNAGLTNFVGGHPLAGSEKRGAEAWDAGLFAGKNWFVADARAGGEQERQLSADVIRTVGANPIEIDPVEHDSVFALTSNLPHLFAFLLRRMFDDLDTVTAHRLFSCSSFHGATRIASSEPEMVHQMLWHNSENLGRVLNEFSARLKRAQAAIENGNETEFRDLFS